jgi:hypothetical protein
VKPTGQGLSLANRAGLSRLDQKSRLQSIFGIMDVAERAPANPQDHRPVPPHEGGERSLIIAAQEIPKQRVVGLLGRLHIGGQAPDVSEHGRHSRLGHRFSSPQVPEGSAR